jgi:hypothetical protein
MKVEFPLDMMTMMYDPLISFIELHRDLFWTLNKTSYSIGQIFSVVPRLFSPYIEFSRNYQQIYQFFASAIEETTDIGIVLCSIESMDLKEGKNDFFSYLITPIQRIPRYIMLLKELLKMETISEEANRLQEAIHGLNEFTTSLNTTVRIFQDSEKMRKLWNMMEGWPSEVLFFKDKRRIVEELEVVHEKKRRSMIIFDDLILILQNYVYIESIPLIGGFFYVNTLSHENMFQIVTYESINTFKTNRSQEIIPLLQKFNCFYGQ